MTDLDSGYLVVLADPRQASGTGEGGAARPAYRGICRVPTYPAEHAQEADALDFYVFGRCKDEHTNLIPSIDAARALRDWLSRGGREFEVLLCCGGPGAPSLSDVRPFDVEVLGFDVAGVKGDYWSIVADFSQSPWAERFVTLLNTNGLFDLRGDAESYLREYQRRGEPDSEGQEVVYVVRIGELSKRRGSTGT